MYVLFKPIDVAETYEIGWIFNKNYWRKGYAFEICNKLICHGFESMGIHKICAEAVDGVKSVSLMEKLGMVQESIKIKHSKSNDGQWKDLYCYAISVADHFHSNKEQL